MITIAVLPLTHRGKSEEAAFFSDGITEEIIHALAKIEALRVTSRVSSFYYKDKQLPLQQIATELGVAVILSGSVQIANQTLRVSVQLLDAKSDHHFWSERWDRPLDDLFAVQDELSRLIADKLREQYGHLEITDANNSTTPPNISAYSLSLRARQAFNRWNPADCQRAIELYEQALRADGNLVSAYIGLADAYSFLATTQQMPRAEGWRLAMSYTQRGLELQPKHPGLHYLLANQSFFVSMDFQLAQKHTQRALTYDPSHGESRLFSAFLATLSGQWEVAQEDLNEMMRRDPHHPETHFYTAFLHYFRGEFNIAQEKLQQIIDQQPNNVPALVTLAYCLLAQRKPNAALEQLEACANAGVPEVDIVGVRCLAHFQMMANEVAKQDQQQLLEWAQQPDAFQAHVYCFYLYTYLDQLDAAFEWVDAMINMHSSILLLALNSPLVGRIRQDERFTSYFNTLFGAPTSNPTPNPKKPLLPEDVANNYHQRINTFVQKEKPYLNPSLSLRDLAGQLQLHPNQLSWVLNECAQQNFNTYINQYRVDYFKQIAQDPANQHLSLLGLAFESGFNSKTAFNGAFKQLTGMTPSQFLKSK